MAGEYFEVEIWEKEKKIHCFFNVSPVLEVDIDQEMLLFEAQYIRRSIERFYELFKRYVNSESKIEPKKNIFEKILDKISKILYNINIVIRKK